MKNLISKCVIVVAILLTSIVLLNAQAPEGFTYQAEARDSKGKLIFNTSMTVKATILQGMANNMPGVWSWDYPITTDKFGLF